jgi:hypothetical protein
MSKGASQSTDDGKGSAGWPSTTGNPSGGLCLPVFLHHTYGGLARRFIEKDFRDLSLGIWDFSFR